MKRFLLLCLLTLPVLAGPAAAAGPDWRSWDAGLREARSTGRPVVVDVYTDWCGWCKRMDRDVYARRDVQDYLARKFVMVRLNAESRAAASYEGRSWTSQALAERLGVTGYPTTLFLGSTGARLGAVPGYLPAARFLSLLRYIGEGYMERGVSFEDYERRGGAAPGGARR